MLLQILNQTIINIYFISPWEIHVFYQLILKYWKDVNHIYIVYMIYHDFKKITNSTRFPFVFDSVKIRLQESNFHKWISCQVVSTNSSVSSTYIKSIFMFYIVNLVNIHFLIYLRKYAISIRYIINILLSFIILKNISV